MNCRVSPSPSASPRRAPLSRRRTPSSFRTGRPKVSVLPRNFLRSPVSDRPLGTTFIGLWADRVSRTAPETGVPAVEDCENACPRRERNSRSEVCGSPHRPVLGVVGEIVASCCAGGASDAHSRGTYPAPPAPSPLSSGDDASPRPPIRTDHPRKQGSGSEGPGFPPTPAPTDSTDPTERTTRTVTDPVAPGKFRTDLPSGRLHEMRSRVPIRPKEPHP